MADFSANTDPSRLEGRPKNEEKKLPPRDFFWDSVALYVVSVIMGLAVIDVVTEFIRNSDVSCYAPSGAVLSVRQEDYINNFCSASLPITEYFPAFIVVHGILIAIPHYLWLNHYGGSFDFFFAQASDMDRTHDKKKGEYSDKNYLIIQQLTLAFTTYKQNWMYRLYFLKLWGQFFISAAGFFVTVFYFTDYNDTFYCPRNFNSSNNAAADSEFWPFDVQVRCVFNSLRLYSTIRIADMILVALLILCYIWAIFWCGSGHSTQLGAKQVAEFSFQSGMSPEHYVSKGIFSSSRCRWFLACCKSQVCRNRWRKICSFFNFVLSPFCIGRHPSSRIETNLDFLVLKLFRTDSGLGHVFRDMQILCYIKEFENDDQAKTQLYREQKQLNSEQKQPNSEQEQPNSEQEQLNSEQEQPNSEQEQPNSEQEQPNKELITSEDLQWTFTGDDRYDPIPFEKLVIPNSIRGAIIGFSACAPSSCFAVYITFGSPSLGIATALSRVFAKVGVINFSSSYHATKLDELAVVKHLPPQIVNVLCPKDVFSSEDKYSNQLFKVTKDAWKVTPAPAADQGGDDQEGNAQGGNPQGDNLQEGDPILKPDFIVVGPILMESHKTAVTLFLNHLSLKHMLEEECKVLTMTPIRVADKDTQFLRYELPEQFFQLLTGSVEVKTIGSLSWPSNCAEEINCAEEKIQFDEYEILCGDSFCSFDFRMYECRRQHTA